MSEVEIVMNGEVVAAMRNWQAVGVIVGMLAVHAAAMAAARRAREAVV